MAIIESYAEGVPAIGSRIGGIPEIIEEGKTGYIFTPQNDKELSQLSGEILPQRKLPRTITLRNISSEIGLIKYIFDVASFEEDLTNRV